MKNIKILLVFISCFLSLPGFGQDNELKNLELENFLLITDQNLYLAGDRVWFAAKLLKNHETYRYSKLAYIDVLDADGKSIHQEKMLMTDQDMIFGDLFIPENSASGVFSILVYTKWMANYADFPIAKKEFLVVNSNFRKAAGKPALFWEQLPIENVPISLFHTSDQAEVIEVQDHNGNTLEVMEAVPPLKKILSKIKPSESYRVIFRGTEFTIQPEKWLWDPSEFSLTSKSMSTETFKIVTHTDWMILEEIDSNGGRFILDKTRYQNQNHFKISVLNSQNQVTWTYQVQLRTLGSGQLQVDSRGKVGEELKLDLIGFPSTINSGIVLASEDENPQILDFIEILNHPNWINLSQELEKPNLISSLDTQIEQPFLIKDYSPMFDYKKWTIDIHSRFRSSVTSEKIAFSLPEDHTENKIKRTVYRDHFEISDEVVALQSPFLADKVYDLQDYDEFPDMESLLKEIVAQVKLKKAKYGVGKEIFIANTDNQNMKFNKKPLLLIDFYKPVTPEDIWKLDLATLDRIELYYHRSTVEKTNLGEAVGDGLIVFYTKNNEYFLKKNLPKENYFLSDVSVPRRPDYPGQDQNSISANSLQFLDTGLTFQRGRSKSGNLKFDTAGSWLIEAWLFGNTEYEQVQRKIVVDLK